MGNKLIVFEGIDGVGKSTLCAELKKELKRKGIKAVLYEDFERNKVGFGVLKSFIKQKVRPLSVNSSLYFYLSSALYKSEVIKKLLKKSWVICDRYIYSTIADHVVGGVDKVIVPDLKKFPFLKPDFAFWVVVSDKIRLGRVKARGLANKQELVPLKPGTRAHKLEKEYCRMGLVEISNDDDISKTVSLIAGKVI